MHMNDQFVRMFRDLPAWIGGALLRTYSSRQDSGLSQVNPPVAISQVPPPEMSGRLGQQALTISGGL